MCVLKNINVFKNREVFLQKGCPQIESCQMCPILFLVSPNFLVTLRKFKITQFFSVSHMFFSNFASVTTNSAPPSPSPLSIDNQDSPFLNHSRGREAHTANSSDDTHLPIFPSFVDSPSIGRRHDVPPSKFPIITSIPTISERKSPSFSATISPSLPIPTNYTAMPTSRLTFATARATGGGGQAN